MPGNVFCTNCGVAIGEDWRFCEACGSEQLSGLVAPAGAIDSAAEVKGEVLAHPNELASTGVAPQADGTPTIQVGGSPVTIGRSPDCDAVIDDSAVSMRHVVFTATQEGLHFLDLGSSTGVRHNGFPAKRGVLNEGERVGVGHHSWIREGTRLVPENRQFPPLEARGIEARAGTTTLLEPTTLRIDEGELVAIIGPSGSGKSTLLKALGGVRAPNSGSVLVRGDYVGLRQADLGYVPQDDTLHHLLSIHEALSFAAQLRLPEDHTEDECEAAIAAVLEQVGLADISDRRIGDLSGGQRKRAAVALELVSEPELLLLDEPTTGLDPGLERHLMELTRRIADKGQSVLLVTHATQSLDLCDRVAIMAPGGRLAYLGPPADAAAKFGVEGFEKIYEELGTVDDGGKQGGSSAVSTPTSPPRIPSARVVPRRQIWPQVNVLVRRYALLFVRDRRNAKILAAQVLILALVSAFLFGSDVFSYDALGSALHSAQSAQLLFLVVTVSLWFGAISSVRQIVAERSVLTRELAAGVRTEAYLFSKALVIGAVSALQTVVFVWIVFALRPLHDVPSGAKLTIAMICVLVSWVGVGFGLTLSAFARSENQATSFLPLILLPQLLFGGAIVTTKDLGQPIQWISHLAASQWGFAGAGNVVEMNARIAADPSFSRASHYSSNFFNHGEIQVAIALSLMIGACAVVLQARLRPPFEDTWWQQGRQWWERKMREQPKRYADDPAA